MNKKSKEKIPSVFQIFRKSEDPTYPELLVKFLSAEDVIGFQLEKAQYLLNIWTEQYSRMPQIGKSTYYNVIPKLLKHLYSIYTQKKKGMESISTLYFLVYKKWPEITSHVQKGLKESDHETLILMWSISFRMIKSIQLIQREQFGQFLAQNFEEPLSMFKWKSHTEKVYILQIIKYINNDIQYKPFVNNGEKWTQIIRTIKQEPFKSEIVKEKGEMHLEVFKYEYEQIKINKQKIAQATSPNELKKKKLEKKISFVQDNPLQKQKEKQKQNQYLSREQIHMFLVVKDEFEEKQIYRIQLLSEIISCRPLMFLICEEYWESLTYQVILQIQQKIETLNIEVRTDMLLSKMFLGLLKYKKTSHIIRERIGEEIVVKIIKNIELFNQKSPFETQQFSQIPTLVNESFFYISTQMQAKKITVETIINKRVKSILDQGNMGKDDIISRSLMTVSCREEITLKLPIIKDIKQFLMTVKKKKGVKIETCIILVKILLSASNSPQFNQINAFNLALCLTQLSQLFGANQKVTQLRKLDIQLLNKLIPLVAANEDIDEQQYGILIDDTLKWLQIVELNFTIVYAPMINIMILFINRYQQYFLSQERTMEYLERILTGLMQKLGHEHNSENMFAFLDCLLKSYVRFQWGPAQIIYEQVPSSSYVDWQILYQKQAKILFKKEEEIKWNAKMEQEKAKKQKQLKWSSLMKRRQTIANSSTSVERKSSINQDETNDTSTSFDISEQKKYEQKMAIFFGPTQIKWLRQLITNHELWNNQALIKSQLGCLQYSLIQTISSVEKQYFLKNQRPNEFMKKIIASLDDDMYDLFNYLMEVQAYQSLFLFASQIYFTCRDFPFVCQLRSYQLMLNKCFEILSVFFNKVEVLYASSAFCSLLLPYANHRDLKMVYDELNRQEFLTDLFKGSNEFIGKQKCYYPWLIKILMAYEITDQFRQKNRLLKESLQTLGKNVVWWGNVMYLINAQIDVEDHEVKESKILIFDIFKEQYRKIVNDYFSRVQKSIEVGIKHRQLIGHK